MTALSNTDLVFATPRKLPRASRLKGRVVVLDIAFAANTGSSNFSKVTGKFISDIGDRLAAWVDHHDHDLHVNYQDDDRFVLSTKQEHGACPEMITPTLVERCGHIDTIICHQDFDGLSSAAKWLRGGVEPYPGCDEDARCIDTRLGTPSPLGVLQDRALRARPKDQALFGIIVRFLAGGARDNALRSQIVDAAKQFDTIERHTRVLAQRYHRLSPGVAVVDITGNRQNIDKTQLLLQGQQREPIAIILDDQTINIAARFDGGINLLQLLGISGGMPTRVSIPMNQLNRVCDALGVSRDDMEQVRGTTSHVG